MFSDDIWAEVTRMCRTLEERGLGTKSWEFSALGAEKEEGGHVVGAREGGGRTCCRS